MTRDQLAERYAIAKRRHKGQAEALRALQDATHAILAHPPKPSIWRRIWGL